MPPLFVCFGQKKKFTALDIKVNGPFVIYTTARKPWWLTSILNSRWEFFGFFAALIFWLCKNGQPIFYSGAPAGLLQNLGTGPNGQCPPFQNKFVLLFFTFFFCHYQLAEESGCVSFASRLKSYTHYRFYFIFRFPQSNPFPVSIFFFFQTTRSAQVFFFFFFF